MFHKFSQVQGISLRSERLTKPLFCIYHTLCRVIYEIITGDYEHCCFLKCEIYATIITLKIEASYSKTSMSFYQTTLL
jgi:hypothetical protein